eukprot:6463265-Amphidinium_carterae.1
MRLCCSYFNQCRKTSCFQHIKKVKARKCQTSWHTLHTFGAFLLVGEPSWLGSFGGSSATTCATLGACKGVTLLDAATEWYGAAVTFDASGACADSSEVILAVIAEEPYAEYLGDVEDLKLRAEDASMLDRVVSRKSAKKVPVLFS